MAVTLMEILKNSTATERMFITDLLRATDLIGEIPFKSVDGLLVEGSRWQNLPTVAFRQINGSYTVDEGDTEEVNETLSVLGGQFAIDHILRNVKAKYQDEFTKQSKMLATAIAFKFTDTFINGDQAVDPNAFEGIKKRVGNMPSRMTVDLAQSTDALKVLASTANEHLFIDAVEEAIKKSSATHAFMNENTWLKISAALRRSGTMTTTKDMFDRSIKEWNGVKFVDVGLKADKSTEIITSTEDPGDGGNDATSIYFVNLNTEDGLHGLQLSGTSPKPKPLQRAGTGTSATQDTALVDWAVGLRNLSQYCICRVKGMKMAAA